MKNTTNSDQIERMDLNSMNVSEQKQSELLNLFPEVRTEGGKIDFERLKRTLGSLIDSGKERYGMIWPGKSESFKTIQTQSLGTLLPIKEESLNFDSTENIIIEGDNLEVLKLLQKSYLGKVKMIFIDPPYNTGNDFIYPDNYTESLETYLTYTNQVDSEGKKFGTNMDTDGRFHSKWMSMMYPRLYLARNLLREDGTIFISIDDNEVTNLRKLCDEIFGEENFVADLIWEKRFTRNNDAKLMSSVYDHILLYRKSFAVEYLREPRTEKANSIYSNPDNDPRGPWTSVSYISQRTKDQRPNLAYKVKNPFTNAEEAHPINAWKYGHDQYLKHAEENRLYWGKKGENQFPRLKRFLAELNDGIVPINLWNYKDTGTIDDGTKIVDELLGKDVFDYPKPPSLISRMLAMATSNEDDIILDFFAGSGTTAHAVLEKNYEDGGARKFILVQLPEPTPEGSVAKKLGFNKISDVTRTRVLKVCTQLLKKSDEDAKQQKLTDEEPKRNDFGFKFFKLSESNFKVWNQEANSQNELTKQLELHVDHVKDDRTSNDILYEILLKSGFPLTTKVETQMLGKQTIYSIAGGMLLVCLEEKLGLELIKYIADQKPERVVCLDKGFENNDQLKANAVQIFRTKGVVSFKTV